MNFKQFIHSLVLIASSSGLAFAQNPVGDTSVVQGTLPNGLTYYILPSKNSGNQADFFLARSVGTVNEEEDQRGLAHFLEHLCFNGTKHFPGNSVISYLESVGVKFGKNLNASTSQDRTIYNISKVPTSRQSTLDSCLLILRDWSGDVSLKDDDINNERGVIHNEWRTRRSATNRMLEKALPRLYPGSIYGQRMPIGLMEVVDNFPPKRLRDFYNKWHRADNEAIVVVGDVDPSHIESEIKRLFSDLPKPKKSTFSADIPDNDKLLVVTETDPEQPVVSLTLYFKYPRPGVLSLEDDIRREILNSILSDMLVNRYNDIELKENPACSRIGLGDNRYLLASPVRALMVRANVAPGRSVEGITDLYSVVKRAYDLGFSNEEFAEAKDAYLKTLSRANAKASLRSNTDQANRLVRTYLDGERFDSPASRLEAAQDLIDHIKVEDVTEYLRKLVDPSGRNIVALCYSPENETGVTAPSANELEKAFYAVNKLTFEPYVPTKIELNLLTLEPEQGKVVASEPLDTFGQEVLTLSNGIKVHLRPSKLTEDEVLVRGVGYGGLSQQYRPEISASMKMLEDVIPLFGFGKFSSSDLQRYMHGRTMKVGTAISNTEETMELSSNNAELEDAFRLMYLKATDPRKDEAALRAFTDSRRHSLARIFKNPVQVMGDSITSIIYSHQPLGAKVKLSTLEAFDMDTALNVYRDRFADFSDFTFYVAGDFDRDRLVNLIERYIASLPTNGRIESPKDIGYRFPQGQNEIPFTTPMETPLGVVYQFRNLECPYTLDNILMGSAVGQVLKARLLADLREEKGWTYSITGHASVVNGLNGDDPSVFMMPIHIKTSPEHVQEIDQAIKTAVSDMADGNISESELAKVKEYFLKNIKENRGDNGYWLVAMRALDKWGLDLDSDYESSVASMTPSSMASFVKQYVLPANLTTIRMTPAE